MSTIAIFVDRQTLSYSKKLGMLMRIRDSTEGLGHGSYFIFPTEIKKVVKTDALFIRARTDPLNISYVAAKMAALHGIPVIDDPRSILICSDKVNMYLHLMKAGVPIPHTEFMSHDDIRSSRAKELFATMGTPLILKEPSTSYSLRVKKLSKVSDLIRTARGWNKLSDLLVVQEYIDSTIDWRIGVLGGRLLFASKYALPREGQETEAYESEEVPYYSIECVPRTQVPQDIIDLAVSAASAIGSGLYSVDIKEREGKRYVIEVNDNPSLESGEDELYPDVYNRIITHLLQK
jgi:glutathione synthase/RimK-type ligase-like ATP-grasp enzyme